MGCATSNGTATSRSASARPSGRCSICSSGSSATGRTIVGYGAPGKGNTLLNYCGIRTDFLDFTVDRNPYKQGRFLPGTHIPIHPPERIDEVEPDYVLILPWNFKDEILAPAGARAGMGSPVHRADSVATSDLISAHNRSSRDVGRE